MQSHFLSIAVAIMLLPLAGSLIAGLLGKYIGIVASHRVTITLVGISFLLSCYLFVNLVLKNAPPLEGVIYPWISSGVFNIDIALLLDNLSITMACIVTFVSLMVHIYTIGYMEGDPGYTRFFSYVSLFTFAMLALVLANNFLLMFFGWEGVGLVSYLLIGFWFERESANQGSLKAFLVNRLGDIGFILALACILKYFGTLNFHDVFANVNGIIGKTLNIFPNTPVLVVTLICVLLFSGAMAKSAQIPLHVWLPESMEGPTPISALIHAATMVTAGIYMVARCSPLFEYSQVALSLVLIVGATTALFMGFLAIVNHDIKRVIAYSTISQLGYMTVALGASAYDAAIFHLITHAFFKALLFLAAGSVIIAMHHEQDMRKMGGLVTRMPITYLTFLIGSLALAAIPPFSGFFSKDMIIDAVHLSTTPGATYAYYCVLIGAFFTPLYTFRALFLTFHGVPRMDQQTREHVKESPWVVLLPLIGLAIPSLVAGGILIGPMLFAKPTLLNTSIFVLPSHNVIGELAHEFVSATHMALTAGSGLTLWLALGGIVTAWLFNLRSPQLATRLKTTFPIIYKVLMNKYGFDEFNQKVIVNGSKRLGSFFYNVMDLTIIDGFFVNGLGRLVRWFAFVSRLMQTGYIYHYSLAMILGVVIFLGWFLLRF